MKKKNTMVRYALVPNSDDGSIPRHTKCLTLTKSKLIAILVIGLVTLGLVSLRFIHSDTWSFKHLKNLTECLVGNNLSDPDGTPIKLQSEYIRRLPVAIIIGARKAGTRALLRFLNLHSDVVTSKHEPHFFDKNYEKGLKWYLSQMPESYPHQITLEKTPNYFVDWDVPERVHDYNSSIKLLLILRNPIDRAVSDYVQLKGKDKRASPPTFETLTIDPNSGEINKSYAAIKRSLYCRHLERWREFFPLSQIHIVNGEKIKIRPWEELHKVEQFLGISHQVDKSRFIFNTTKGFFCVKLKKFDLLKVVKSSAEMLPFKERCLSPTKGREHPKIDPDVRQKLAEYFEPFNERLYKKLGRKFDWN